jgi:hypothetical protein
MVFVWSYLTKGDANYTLVQVSVNDLILLVLFIPIIGLLFSFFGIQVPTTSGELGIPYDALVTSVLVFVLWHDAHNAWKFVSSSGEPPSAIGTMWSTWVASDCIPAALHATHRGFSERYALRIFNQPAG